MIKEEKKEGPLINNQEQSLLVRLKSLSSYETDLSELANFRFVNPIKTETENIIIQQDNPNNEKFSEIETEDDEYYYQPRCVDSLSPLTKKILLYTSLSSIAVILVIFLGISIKNSLGQTMLKLNFNEELKQMGIYEEDFQNNIKALQDNIDEFGSIFDKTIEKKQYELIKNEIIEDKIKQDVIEELEKKLQNLNQP